MDEKKRFLLRLDPEDYAALEKWAADVSDPIAARAALADAAVVYHCGNPPYTEWATTWPTLQAAPLAAAVSLEAVYVAADNRYLYSPGTAPLHPDSSIEPIANSGLNGARSLRTSTTSSSPPSACASCCPIGTAPRGIARISGFLSF